MYQRMQVHAHQRREQQHEPRQRERQFAVKKQWTQCDQAGSHKVWQAAQGDCGSKIGLQHLIAIAGGDFSEQALPAGMI